MSWPGRSTTDDVPDSPTRSAPVLLVCAPAGYGKTTALAALAEADAAAGHLVTWVTCERNDDATSFWSAILRAATLGASGSAGRLSELRAPIGTVDSNFIEHLVQVLLEESPGLLLVLDDVHEIQDRGLLEGITQLTEMAGLQMRVALGCRFEPPLSLYRLRLTGRLEEIRARDLAFTLGESSRVWEEHELNLDRSHRETLHRLTEGWPAAVRLASLALRDEHDHSRFVSEFHGATRPICDYLTGEVLARLPTDVLDFLMCTSVVEHLPTDLAGLLSGREDALSVLEELAERNALVTRVDGSAASYRYHVLLRTYLHAALRRRKPGESANLQRVAAQWFADHGDPGQALELALLAGEGRLVEDVLRTHGLKLLLAGAGRSVRQATGTAPLPGMSPAVLAHRALLAVEDGDGVAADEAIAALTALPDNGKDARLTALRKLAVLHRARLAADLATAHASDLVEGGNPPHLPLGLDPDIRLQVLADRGALRLFEGDHAGARQDLRRATELATASGLDSVRMYCMTLLAGTQIAANDIRGTQAAAEDAISFATARGWERTPTMAYAYALAGWVSFQLLEPVVAADCTALSLDVIDTTIDVEVEGAARNIAATVSFDDPLHRRAAMEQLEHARGWLGEGGGSPALTAMVAPHELRMCLELGEWRLADGCVERVQKRLGITGDVAVLQAQLATARGRPLEARRLLEPVLTGELAPLRTTALTAAWLLEALLARRADRNPAASEAVLTALSTARASGALRPFLDAGGEVHLLLANLRTRAGHLESVLHEVLTGIRRMSRWQESARAASGGRPATPGPTALSARYLTERELVFLRELPSMLTLGEIAEAQGVSSNTAKTHVRSIYTKLGATTRREAISTAHALELL